jgi:hypothetical protein
MDAGEPERESIGSANAFVVPGISRKAEKSPVKNTMHHANIKIIGAEEIFFNMFAMLNAVPFFLE